MEALREELYRYIDTYGPLDPRTVEISQLLDKEIVRKMKKGSLSYQN